MAERALGSLVLREALGRLPYEKQYTLSTFFGANRGEGLSACFLEAVCKHDRGLEKHQSAVTEFAITEEARKKWCILIARARQARQLNVIARKMVVGRRVKLEPPPRYFPRAFFTDLVD